jgi:hypothetical protein
MLIHSVPLSNAPFHGEQIWLDRPAVGRRVGTGKVPTVPPPSPSPGKRLRSRPLPLLIPSRPSFLRQSEGESSFSPSSATQVPPPVLIWNLSLRTQSRARRISTAQTDRGDGGEHDQRTTNSNGGVRSAREFLFSSSPDDPSIDVISSAHSGASISQSGASPRLADGLHLTDPSFSSFASHAYRPRYVLSLSHTR